MISIKNLSLTLKGKPILDMVSLSLLQGSAHCIIGPSGAGKTSLLKCIANLYSGYSGSIEYKGSSLAALTPAERAHTLGFVFQQFNLFPHMNVLTNCSHALIHVLKLSPQQAHSQAIAALKNVEMEDFKERYPHQLSGGQQQRIAIARALCLEPQVLMFDEPTSALDPASSKNLITLLKRLRAKGITLLVSSHDMPFVKAVGDMLHCMKNGKLVESRELGNSASLNGEFISSFFDEEIFYSKE